VRRNPFRLVLASAGDSDDDVWYKFTATAATQHLVYNLLNEVEPVIQWYSGSCGALTSLACDATKATGLTPGQEYRIRLHSEGATSTLRMLADVCESAANDECSGAIPIAVALTGEEPEEVVISTRYRHGQHRALRSAQQRCVAQLRRPHHRDNDREHQQ
jgi:hypothetical protein